MQKFGLLYLRGGVWEGKRLLSKAWVDQSFQPWIASSGTTPNYGWYWWTFDYAPGWHALVADGWRGQRISIVPEQNVVITMTGDVEDEDEEALYQRIVKTWIIPAVTDGKTDPSLRAALVNVMEQVRQGPLRVKPDVEARMVPSIGRKGTHHSFMP
jgi:CubicO group peptidase (beta-lactamase class C family)